MTQFPKTLAAVERAETSDQWAIGDALLKEVGKPSVGRANDGSHARLAECAAELVAHGFEYSVPTLRDLREVAAAFPHACRRACSFAAHRDAGSPEMLDLVIEQAGKKPLTRSLVRSTAQAIRAEQQRKADVEKAKKRARADEARRKAEEAKRRAEEEQTAAAQAEADQAQAAADEAEESAKSAPKPNPPTLEEVNLTIIREELIGLGNLARAKAHSAAMLLEEHGADLPGEYLENIVETFRDAANQWAQLAAHYGVAQVEPRKLVAVAS